MECFSCRRCEEKFSQVIKRHEQNCHSFSAGGRQEVRGSGGRQEARGSGGYWETEAGKEILPVGQGPGGNQDAMVSGGCQGFKMLTGVQEVFRRAGDQVVGRRLGPGGDQGAKCSGSCLVVMQLRFAVV